MNRSKKKYAIIVVTAVVLSLGLTAMAWAMEHEHDDIASHPKCAFCGMDRLNVAYARMLVTYSDHTTEGYCSLHCAALKIAYKMGKAPVAMLVADHGSLHLIPAHKASWVTGGNERGVMTHNAKWAFAAKADAQSFIHAHGGSMVNYEIAMQTAYSDLYADTKMFWPKSAKKSKHGMKHRHH